MPAGLRPGTFKEYFDPDNDGRVSEQAERMKHYSTHEGSSYWFVKVGKNTKGENAGLVEAIHAAPAALVKISPSRATLSQKARIAAPNMYINDIAVSAPMCQQLLGANMLHAVVKFGGYQPEVSATLDGYEVSEDVNEWYQRLGFRPVLDVPKTTLELPDGQALTHVRLTTGRTALRDIASTLESRHSHLRHAVPTA